jgi:hypothetical protein
VAVRIARWSAEEKEKEKKENENSTSTPLVEGRGCHAPMVEASVGGELMRSLRGRERALEADNESLRLQVKKLECDLAQVCEGRLCHTWARCLIDTHVSRILYYSMCIILHVFR